MVYFLSKVFASVDFVLRLIDVCLRIELKDLLVNVSVTFGFSDALISGCVFPAAINSMMDFTIEIPPSVIKSIDVKNEKNFPTSFKYFPLCFITRFHQFRSF